jgi:excisionase family DNA binding protein
VAKILNVTATTVSNWARDGLLDCVKLPSGHRRFRREDIDALLRGDAA